MPDDPPRGDFASPCCGLITLTERPPGTFEINGACGWEDDYVQFYDPDRRGGANIKSLRECRARWESRLAARQALAERKRREQT